MFSFECWPVFKLECTANTTLVYDVTWLVFWKLSTIVSRLTMFQLKKTLDSLCIPLSIYLHTKLRRIQISAYVAKYGTSFLPTPPSRAYVHPFLLFFSIQVAAEAMKRNSLHQCSLFWRLKTAKFWVARCGHFIRVVILWEGNDNPWLIQVMIGWGFASDYLRG